MRGIIEHVRGAGLALLWTMYIEITSILRYRFAFVSDVLVYTLVFALLMVVDAGQSLSRRYAYGDYRALLFSGYIAWTFASAAISTSVGDTSVELMKGTLYRKLQSRFPLEWFQLGGLLSALVVHGCIIACLSGIAFVVWGLEPMIDFTLGMYLIIASLGMYGMGLIMGGLTIRFKKIGSLQFLLQLVLLFVSNAVPAGRGIAAYSRVIPLTMCSDLIRLHIAGLTDPGGIACLCVVSVLWVVVGCAVFRWCLACAKQRGNLLFY